MNAVANLSEDTGGSFDGRYRVGRVVARKESHLVCEVRHVHTHASRTMKVLPKERKDDALARRALMIEAAVFGRLAHPGLARVVDAGDAPDGGPFLVAERHLGRSLDGLLALRSRLSEAETCELLRGLGSALVALHEVGLVLHDLRPSHVTLSTDLGERPVIVNASSIGTVGALRSASLPVPGRVDGDDAWVAPECYEDGHVDVRADVFSLGAIAFECLLGRTPVRARSRTSEPPDASYDPSNAAVLARSGISPALGELVARMIDPDPMRRIATVAEVLARLDVPRDPSPVADQAPRPGEVKRAHRRIPYVAPLRILRMGSTDVDGRAEDIGLGGVLLISQQLLELGDVVMVRIPLPISGKLAAIPSTVRWVKPGRLRHAIGLSFDDLAEAARDEIARYVDICTAHERTAGAA